MEIITLIVLIAVYFLPTIVASVRGAKSVNGVATLNLFLGWTCLGWLVAFVWAFGRTTADDDRNDRKHAELMAALAARPADAAPAVFRDPSSKLFAARRTTITGELI